jgi:hypothetical protein
MLGQEGFAEDVYDEKSDPLSERVNVFLCAGYHGVT